MKDKESQLKALIEELGKIRGRHTELVSVYIPAGFNLAKVVEQIRSEQGTAQNIKSKQVRKNVVGALEKILQHLKLYKQTPGNGLAIFSGNVSDKEGVTDLEIWAVEPHEPLKSRLYWCGQNFILDPLKEMVREREIYGLIVLDKSDATIGLLRGTKIEKLKDMDSLVPGKTKAGGWCVHGDTLLHMADGGLTRIKDVGGREFLCYDLSKLRISKSKHNHYFSRQSNQDMEISTQFPAFRIRTTPEHKFFVSGKNGFETKRAGELESGDRVIIVKRFDVKGSKIGINADIPKRYILNKAGLNLIMKRRKELNLSQKEVANRLNITQTAISRLELGKSNLKTNKIEQLLELLGISRRFLKENASLIEPIRFPYYIGAELAQILGYLLGDGNAEKQRIAISEGDKQVIELYKRMTEKLFGITTSLKLRTGKGYWQLRLNSVPLLNVIQERFPTVLNPFNKDIPQSILKTHPSILSRFVRGFFDAEGYSVISNKSVGIATNSYEVMTKLQQCLLRFGIVSSFREMSMKGSYAKRPRYSIVITDFESLQRFSKHIGFSSKKKTKILKELIIKSETTRTDQIPLRGSHIIGVLKKIGLNTLDFPKTGTGFFNDSRNMSYNIFKKRIIPVIENRIKELEIKDINPARMRKRLRVPYHEIADRMGITKSSVFQNIKYSYNTERINGVLEIIRKEMLKEAKSIRRLFLDILKSNLISASIKSIKKVKPEGLYYDMEIPVFENFIANGFLIHNSQARFARVREGLLNDFMKKVGDVASSKFRELRDLQGVIVGGPGPIKEQFTEGDFLHYEVKKKVIGIVNTSYTGDYGLRETVERAEDIISEASIIKERKVLERFFDEFGKDSGLAVYGFKEVMDSLKSGNLEVLILSEEFDWLEVELECSCGFKTKKLLSRRQLEEQHCPQCNSKMGVAGERLLTEDIVKMAEKMSTTVEVVSSNTGMGEQIRELGGIVGILRFRA